MYALILARNPSNVIPVAAQFTQSGAFEDTYPYPYWGETPISVIPVVHNLQQLVI